MSIVNDASRRIEQNLEGYITVTLLFVYTFLIAYTVFQRSTFENPPSYTLSVTLLLFTWMTWLAAGWAIRFDSHFRFSLVRDKLSNRMNYLLRYVDFVSWVGFALVVGFYSLESVQARMESGRAILGTPIPLWVAYVAVPVGMAVIIVRATQQMVRLRRRYKDGDDITPTSDIQK
jgi:TRAP-type C4-dicarboxylate transport system permease small subunit